jgi:RHS repeat-associated protein
LAGPLTVSLLVACVPAGAARTAPEPAGHVRTLTAAEMRAIAGAQKRAMGGGGGENHVISVDPAPGTTYSWEGTTAGTNTGNGNKLTRIPLVGWTARGGMPVEFALYHNSQGTHNSELGYKWTFSYDIYSAVDAGGNVTVHWGDDLSYTFTKQVDGSYTAPTGVYDTLTANGSPISSYDLKTKDQITYRFTQPNGTGWYCTTIKDLRDNTITIGHNANNFVTSVTDPTSRVIAVAYDGNNRISTVTDPLNRQWSLSYTSGNLTQVTWPTVGGASPNMVFGYDANHCITTLTDRRGKSWTFAYYSDCSLNWLKDPTNNQTTLTYTSGQTVIADPNGHTVKHNYTSGRLVSVVDQLNNTESYTYNAANQVTRVTDRRGKTWDRTYDSAGNVLTVTDPLSHTTTHTYNSRNQPLTVTTDMGKQTAITYSANGLPNTVELKDSGGITRSTTTYTWSASGTLSSKRDDNDHETTYGRDTNGHLTSVTTPNSRVTSVTVNGLGRVTSRTDAMNRTTSYTLDAWERVTGIDYPSGTDTTFSYDAENHLTGWTDAQGTWARTYDDAGRITAETLGGNTRSSYSWDATGKKQLLSSMTDASSRTVTYAYTSRNQLYQVSESAGTATYSYDADGNETGTTLQNCATVTKAYDDAGRLTSVTNKNSGNTTLSSFSYSYNDDNQRTGITEADNSTVSYSYNGIGRLTGETRTGTNAFTASYTLDGVGNRTAQTVGGNTTSFTLNSDDELTATSGGFTNSYSYNANGEQTSRTLGGAAYTLSYDYDGQLTQITQGQTTTDFAYDALGRRFSRTAGGTTTEFLYGAGGMALEKQGGSYTQAYTQANGLLRRGTEYPMYDGHGSERTVTSSNQTVTGSVNYEAFGQVAGSSGSSSNPYMYAGDWGYRNDGDAGVMHVGARYYDAQVGRFITRDTVLSEHAYLYCDGNPVDSVDPTGAGPEQMGGQGRGGRLVLPRIDDPLQVPGTPVFIWPGPPMRIGIGNPPRLLIDPPFPSGGGWGITVPLPFRPDDGWRGSVRFAPGVVTVRAGFRSPL